VLDVFKFRTNLVKFMARAKRAAKFPNCKRKKPKIYFGSVLYLDSWLL